MAGVGIILHDGLTAFMVKNDMAVNNSGLYLNALVRYAFNCVILINNVFIVCNSLAIIF